MMDPRRRVLLSIVALAVLLLFSHNVLVAKGQQDEQQFDYDQGNGDTQANSDSEQGAMENTDTGDFNPEFPGAETQDPAQPDESEGGEEQAPGDFQAQEGGETSEQGENSFPNEGVPAGEGGPAGEEQPVEGTPQESSQEAGPEVPQENSAENTEANPQEAELPPGADQEKVADTQGQTNMAPGETEQTEPADASDNGVAAAFPPGQAPPGFYQNYFHNYTQSWEKLEGGHWEPEAIIGAAIGAVLGMSLCICCICVCYIRQRNIARAQYGPTGGAIEL